jgi:hypothetical protein
LMDYTSLEKIMYSGIDEAAGPDIGYSNGE